ncbi:MAG: hypothetical protein ABXS91_08630, partial [Sulfurimonas sp.]
MANTLLLTDQGRQAIADALAGGTTISPKTFKFITPIMAIDSTFTEASIPAGDVWYSGDITEYSVDDSATVSFNCIVEANVATERTGTVGLYLDDGRLFAICSLTSQLPENQRQGVYLRINHDSATSAFNFNFLSYNKYVEDTDIIYLGTTAVQINRASGALVLAGVTASDAQKLEGSTKQQIIDTITAAILNGAGEAYDTLLELQQEIQSNDSDISGILTTLSNKANRFGDALIRFSVEDATSDDHAVNLGQMNTELALKANKGGMSTQRFKVLDAAVDDEAVNKGQMDSNFNNLNNELGDKADKSNVLELDNTDEFTPEEDY